MHRQTPTLGDEQPEPWIGHSVLDLHTRRALPWPVGGQQGPARRRREACTAFCRACACLVALEAVWTEVSSSDCWVSCDILDRCSRPNQVNALGLLTQTTARQCICRGHHPREGLTLRLETIQSRGRALVGVAVSLAGTYPSCAFEAAQISESHFSTTAHTQVYPGNTHTHSLSCSVASKQGMCGRGWGQSIVCEGSMDLHSRLALSGMRKTSAEAWACSTSDAACTVIADTSREPAGAPLTAALLCPGAVSWGREAGRKSSRIQPA